MTEKPLVISLQGNAKIGKQVLNFDRYLLSINYRINSKGITIELSPPQRKKMVDYTKPISPYDPQPKCPRCCFPLKKVKLHQDIKTSCQMKEKDSTQDETLKKLKVQEVFNFSESPMNILDCFKSKPIYQIFPKHGMCHKEGTKENVYKFIANDPMDVSPEEAKFFNCKIRKTSMKHCEGKPRRIKKSKSQPAQISSVTTNRIVRSARTCKSCVIVLKNRMERLQKENLSLRKRLQLIRRI